MNHYPLHEVPFDPDLIVDCGAHVGFFTLLANTTFPNAKILSLEPNPENFKCLQIHAMHNCLSAELINAALAREAGEASFAGHGFLGSLVAVGTAGSIRVRTVALDDLIAQRQPERLIVKMDIEGAENELLPRLVPIMPAECALFFEWHGSRGSWDAVLELIGDAGFRIRVVLDETTADGGVGIAAAIRSSGGDLSRVQQG